MPAGKPTAAARRYRLPTSAASGSIPNSAKSGCALSSATVPRPPATAPTISAWCTTALTRRTRPPPASCAAMGVTDIVQPAKSRYTGHSTLPPTATPARWADA